MHSTTYCCEFFLRNEVRKIKPPHNPEKWTLGRINSHSFNIILSRFLGTRKSNKFHTDNYCTSFNVKLAFLPYLYWHYKLILRLAGVFDFLQMTLPLNKFAHPGLYYLLWSMTEKKALLPAKRIFCNQCSSKGAQMRRTTKPFAQWNLISRTCSIPKACPVRHKWVGIAVFKVT